MRLLIFGNSGSGKTTLARQLASEEGAAHLDLDVFAWDPGPVRRPIEASRAEIAAFIQANTDWVIEGCYGDLIEIAIPFSTEIRFLNPGVERCVANCLRRPWEPAKYASPEAQNEMLAYLLEWVRAYETRDDEFSLTRHRAIFEAYKGPKTEISS